MKRDIVNAFADEYETVEIEVADEQKKLLEHKKLEESGHDYYGGSTLVIEYSIKNQTEEEYYVLMETAEAEEEDFVLL
jgi:hypothetical protein